MSWLSSSAGRQAGYCTLRVGRIMKLHWQFFSWMTSEATANRVPHRKHTFKCLKWVRSAQQLSAWLKSGFCGDTKRTKFVKLETDSAACNTALVETPHRGTYRRNCRNWRFVSKGSIYYIHSKKYIRYVSCIFELLLSILWRFFFLNFLPH